MGALGDAIAKDKREDTCVILEHEDVATRLSQTFMLCPANIGKAGDFKTNMNYVFEEQIAEVAVKDSKLF